MMTDRNQKPSTHVAKMAIPVTRPTSPMARRSAPLATVFPKAQQKPLARIRLEPITRTGLRASVRNKLAGGWATPEGLIILSFILVCIFSGMQLGLNRIWLESVAAFRILSGVIFFMFLIIAIWGVKYLITERKRIWLHEREGVILFLIGTLLTVFIPLSGAISGLAPDEFFATGLLGVNIGIIFIFVGAVMLGWLGGYYTIWFIGLVYYLVMASHEAFLISIYTHHYGPYDQYYGTLGVYLIISSAVILLYHELKFFILGRLIKRANDLRAKGRYKEAIKPLKTALFIYPRYATAWNNKGNIMFNMGDYTEAVKCYDKALALSPDYQLAADNKVLAMQKYRGNPNLLK
jgi:hypothetical protein